MASPDFNSWIRRGPPLHELVSSVSVKSRKGDCALIIAVHNESDVLDRHLDVLSGQSVLDFDVIIVHSPELELSKVKMERPFGVTTVSLYSALGPGAYYAGEKYALRNGYRSLILVDVDCIPLSAGLVRTLRESALSDKGSFFLPALELLRRSDNQNWSLHWYGAMYRSVLETAGLTYLPLYYGYVDVELRMRLEDAGFRSRCLDSVLVEHPLSKRLGTARTLERTLYWLRNVAPMIPTYRRPFLMTALYTLTSLSFFDSRERFLFRVRAALTLFRAIARLEMNRSSAFHGLAVPSYEKITVAEALASAKKPAALLVLHHLGEDRAAALAGLFKSKGVRTVSASAYLVPILAGMLRVIPGTDALLLCMQWSRALNPLLLLVPNLYLYDGEDAWIIQREPNIAARIFRCAASCLTFAFMVAVYSALGLFSFLRMHEAFRRYGLDDDCACAACTAMGRLPAETV
jgi:GT2 family glycosyltransferase